MLLGHWAKDSLDLLSRWISISVVGESLSSVPIRVKDGNDDDGDNATPSSDTIIPVHQKYL